MSTNIVWFLLLSRYKGSMKSLKFRKVNKKPYIKEEQTIQWRKEKKTKHKQWFTKHLRLTVQLFHSENRGINDL